jgi:hypothetical protein
MLKLLAHNWLTERCQNVDKNPVLSIFNTFTVLIISFSDLKKIKKSVLFKLLVNLWSIQKVFTDWKCNVCEVHLGFSEDNSKSLELESLAPREN